MPKWMTAAFALFLSLQVFSTRGETVEDVINKYMQAMGGKDKLLSIKTLYKEGTAEGRTGNKITVRTFAVRDKLLRKEIFSGSDSELIVVTDTNCRYLYSSRADDSQITAMEAVSKWQNYPDNEGPLVNYISKGHKVELLGIEEINGVDCYKIKLVMKSGQIVHYLINSENWLISREIYKSYNNGSLKRVTVEPDIIINYSDYRKTKEGYLFPYKENVNNFTTVISYRTVTVNKPVDGRLYTFGY